MKELKIFSVIRKKKRRYPKNSVKYKTENILNRKFSANISRYKILMNITKFKYNKDKKSIYVCYFRFI